MWWEIVGWLFPSGPSSAQLQTSGSVAINDSIRNRTGSERAPKMMAASRASTSESSPSIRGLQQLTPESRSVASGMERGTTEL